MSVTAQTPFKSFTAAPGATLFSADFRVILASDLVVRKDGVVQTSGFSLSGLGNPSGVDVTFTVPMVGGELIELLRQVPLVRATDYQQLGDFLAMVVNTDFDRIWMALQEKSAELQGVLRAPYPETITDLPAAALRAGTALGFDLDGNPMLVSPASAVTAAQNVLIDDAGGKFTGANVEDALQEVATLAQLAASTGGSLVGFLQSGAGATSRTMLNKAREVFSVKDFGAIGNGSNDDTAEIQAAIDACPSGGIVYFPPGGDYIITSQLVVDRGITLQGSTQYQSAIIAIGCSALLIDFTSNVQVKNLSIAAAVRHTTTPNAFTGIRVTGSTGTRPFNMIFKDVLIDGFFLAFNADWLWGTLFHNFRTNACQIGILANFLCANNVVQGCSFVGSQGLSGGRGIQLNSAASATEGWFISDTLIDDFEIGIEGLGATHVYISNCIIDHNRSNAVVIDDQGADFGGNWTIRGCYIAMQGAFGAAAIQGANSVANSQNRGNIITENQILVYAGSTCLRGIYMVGAAAINNVVSGNTIKGFSTFDIHCTVGPDIVTGNVCQSAIATNIQALGNSILANNRGVITFVEFTQYQTLGQNKVTWSYAVPTSGTWTQGDICYKSNAVASGFIGWVCTAGGTPGTWKTFGAISA